MKKIKVHMYKLQGWYAALENMRFSLPDEDAREKAAGEALPFRIDRFKEAALAVSLFEAFSHVTTHCRNIVFASPWLLAVIRHHTMGIYG